MFGRGGLSRCRFHRTEEAGEEGLEADGVFLGHGDELDAHPFARSDVAYDCGAADFTFGHGEQEGD